LVQDFTLVGNDFREQNPMAIPRMRHCNLQLC